MRKIAHITTGRRAGYAPIKKDFKHLVRIPSGKRGDNFKDLHRVIMNLKAWLRGIHHYVEGLQDYLDEYCYHFNRGFMKEDIFDNLLIRMIRTEPCYIKHISQ